MAVTTIPLTLSHKLWLEIWQGGRPRAWDGTGHYAIARIYDQTIFPDTFGWTHAYFGGMPFPNFYPPLFYWCVALIHHTGLFSFNAAFKIVVALPVLLLPAAVWMLSWATSDRSRLAATGAALAATALMADSRFLPFFPSGLDYFSTFQIGLYTQPLGFVLLVLWYVVYLNASISRRRFTLAALLLALTLLANFFNAVTAAVLISATLVTDTVRCLRTKDLAQRKEERRALVAHLATPVLAAMLTLFWVAPMLSQYDYLVTRPYVIEFDKLISPALWVWYAVAIVGIALWLRRPTRAMWPFLGGCLALIIGIIFASTIAPRWFPLQSSRFLTTLNFLLAVPIGQSLASIFRGFAKLIGELTSSNQPITLRRVRYTAIVAIVVIIFLALTSPGPRWAYAFYPASGKSDVDGILAFARERRDGRYLVEVINPASTEVSFDARAINSFLGAQGNQTLSTVFHEASPNALFNLPTVNAFSQYPDSFGISSLLADDTDFASQPLSVHLERAHLLGVRYLVIRTAEMKDRLAQEAAIGARRDFESWSIFEFRNDPLPRVRVLDYKPALVVSGFSLKQRYSNELSFIRLAEEQFASGWFDVLLARSPETKIDRLYDLDGFGALVIDAYEFDDEEAAFEVLRGFSQDRMLILISSQSRLFQKVVSARLEFPKLEIIERAVGDRGEPLEAIRPTRSYQGSSIRQMWMAIRSALERGKISVGRSAVQVAGEIDQDEIRLQVAGTLPGNRFPVSINTTFHSNWKREDNGEVYAVTPFNMLTFLDEPARLAYRRRWFDVSQR
jgi:hypothetical protein